jgi:hypothetical protein
VEITFEAGSPYYKLLKENLPYSASGVIKDAETFTPFGMPWGTSDALVMEARFTEETTLSIDPSATLVLFIYDDATEGSWNWLANPPDAETPFEYTFEANKHYYLVSTIAGGFDRNASYDLSITEVIGSSYFKLTKTKLPYTASGIIKDAETFIPYDMPWGTSDALVMEAKFTEKTTLSIHPSESLVLFIYDEETAGSWTWLFNPDKNGEEYEWTFEANKLYYLVYTIAGDFDKNDSYDLSIELIPYFRLTEAKLPYTVSGIIKDAETFTSFPMPWGTSDALVMEVKFDKHFTLDLEATASLVLFIYDDETVGTWNWLYNPPVNGRLERWTFIANKHYYLVYTIAGDYDRNDSYNLTIYKSLVGIKEVTTTDKPVKLIRYFDLLGHPVRKDAKGFVFKQIIYEDNTSTVEKTFVLDR